MKGTIRCRPVDDVMRQLARHNSLSEVNRTPPPTSAVEGFVHGLSAQAVVLVLSAPLWGFGLWSAVATKPLFGAASDSGWATYFLMALIILGWSFMSSGQPGGVPATIQGWLERSASDVERSSKHTLLIDATLQILARLRAVYGAGLSVAIVPGLRGGSESFDIRVRGWGGPTSALNLKVDERGITLEVRSLGNDDEGPPLADGLGVVQVPFDWIGDPLDGRLAEDGTVIEDIPVWLAQALQAELSSFDDSTTRSGLAWVAREPRVLSFDALHPARLRLESLSLSDRSVSVSGDLMSDVFKARSGAALASLVSLACLLVWLFVTAGNMGGALSASAWVFSAAMWLGIFALWYWKTWRRWPRPTRHRRHVRGMRAREQALDLSSDGFLELQTMEGDDRALTEVIGVSLAEPFALNFARSSSRPELLIVEVVSKREARRLRWGVRLDEAACSAQALEALPVMDAEVFVVDSKDFIEQVWPSLMGYAALHGQRYRHDLERPVSAAVFDDYDLATFEASPVVVAKARR